MLLFSVEDITKVLLDACAEISVMSATRLRLESWYSFVFQNLNPTEDGLIMTELSPERMFLGIVIARLFSLTCLLYISFSFAVTIKFPSALSTLNESIMFSVYLKSP